jgi:hypothetical protein
MQTGQPWFSEELKTEFESLSYPVYFMDFETVNPAIPRFPGMRPYDHLPFQWSVHVQNHPGATALYLMSRSHSPAVLSTTFEHFFIVRYLAAICHPIH